MNKLCFRNKKIVFFTVFNGLETVLMAAVMRSWLRFGGWRDDASLWPLVVLAGSLQVLEPLTSWLGSDLELALARMRSAGIHIISREMVLFEWVRDASAPNFKQLSQRYLQQKS